MSVHKKNALGFIFVTILIDVIGFGVIIPVMPKLLVSLGHKDLAHAAQDGGWLLGTFAIAQFLFSPIFGGLSDQYGRRPILLLSLLGFGLDYLFLAFAPSIAWLYVGRFIAGTFGASFTTATAYIADISTPEKRAQNFGLVGAAFGAGFIIGPALGGFIAGWGLKAPFILAACLSLANVLYGYFILPESLSPENRRPFSWKRANPIGSLMQLRKYPVVSGLVVSMVLIYIGSHAVQSNWSFYTMQEFRWSERMIGISLGVVGLLVGLVQGALIRIVNPKIGQKNAIYIGLGLYTIGMLAFAFAGNTIAMLLCLIPYCLGGIAGPALQGIISAQVPSNEQGELQGALTSLIAVTSVVGPPLMNGLFSYFSKPSAPIHFPGAPFIAGAVLFGVSIIFAAYTLKRRYFVDVDTMQPAEEALPMGH
jgi:DHA1 family tetracycline resistance protein-like MFS transporter